MKLSRINFCAILPGALSLSLLLAGNASAQTASATTDPVGFTTTTLPANSDSLVSIPFTRPAEYTGLISSISGSTITLAGTPGFTTNQFVYSTTVPQIKTYYAIIGANNAAAAGTVSVTNGSTTITGSGTAFTSYSVGDAITVNGLQATITAINSATSITVDKAYTGATAASASATLDHSPREGSYFTVTANDANSVTVNLNGDSLASIAASLGNTTISLIPYWTLGTAFPDSDAGVSYIVSTGASARLRQSQVLLPDLVTAGINLAPSANYYYLSTTGNVGWRLAGGDSTVSAADTVLLPSTFFTMRNPSSTATTFTPSGGVYMNRVTIPLDTQSSSQQDNAVAVPRPASVALNDLGLISSGAFAASTSGSASRRLDQLLVYDNSSVAFNKSNSAAYYYINATGNVGWRLVGGDATADVGTTTLPYGTGFVIRKAVTTGGATSFWQNTRNY